MFTVIRYLQFVFLLLMVASCGLESAKESDRKQLIIASDFLNHKDVSLFKSFSKQYGIKVTILNMPHDSIMKKLNSEGYSTRIDVILLESSLDFCAFKEKGFLQKILSTEERPVLPYKFRDREYQWFGVAIDPYIIAQKNDSLKAIRNYQDLTKASTWTSDLKKSEDLIPFMAGVVHRTKDNKNNYLYSFSESLFSKETKFLRPTDSAYYFPPLLTKYSSFYSDSSVYSSGYKRARIIFPNQNEGGLFYELRGAAIVKQARNYSNAISFLQYICDERNNQQLNNWWNTFPISTKLERSFTYQNKRFKMYPVAPGDLCDYRNKAEKMLASKRKK